MKIKEWIDAGKLAKMNVDLRESDLLAELTSLGIGGTTDRLIVHESEGLPQVIAMLDKAKIPHRFLGGGTNLLVEDGELSFVVVQLASSRPGVMIEADGVWVDAAADLGGVVTWCAKHDLGGMEGLIGVPGSVGGALRMNAGAYGTEIGAHVREVRVYRHATGQIESLRGAEIRFDYRHTSFAPDDVMLRVRLQLPRKPYKEIVEGIRKCNEKRRASQPLGEKSAGCIFRNPPGASAGRMIDELGLKKFAVGSAAVSERHANFFINRGHASCADMLALVGEVRERVFRAFGAELEHEVILWQN
jgi:UDP-N-acetylmuramate dehydrogenase